MRIHVKEINMEGETPFLDHARKLISDGVKPNTRVVFYDDEYDPRVILPNVGKAAKLTVKDYKLRNIGSSTKVKRVKGAGYSPVDAFKS